MLCLLPIHEFSLFELFFMGNREYDDEHILQMITLLRSLSRDLENA